MKGVKKLCRRLKITSIDVFIYKMEQYVIYDKSGFKYEINKKRLKKKWQYSIKDGEIFVHQSFLFDSVFLLKAVKKNGPVIGDCFTDNNYRGQSIYPIVINRIAKDELQNGTNEVFVVVNRNNISSIKGIEKAGFVIFASIKAKRWLWFYSEKYIEYFT
ncbi:MAG: hypothetical protein ACSHXF_13315 [Aquaticitalea sp.]